MRTITLIALGLALTCIGLVARPWDPAKPENPGATMTAQDTQSWSGILIDADCRAADAADKCEVTETTKTFGLQTSDGKYMKLDKAGNAKVRAALDGSVTKTGLIKVSVSGSMDGEMLVVDAVQIQS